MSETMEMINIINKNRNHKRKLILKKATKKARRLEFIGILIELSIFLAFVQIISKLFVH